MDKIKEGVVPSAKIMAVAGSKPLGTTSSYVILLRKKGNVKKESIKKGAAPQTLLAVVDEDASPTVPNKSIS